MNLEEWKRNKRKEESTEVSLYGMFGYEDHHFDCPITHYYPKRLVSLIYKTFSNVTFFDVYYQITKHPKFTRETVVLSFESNGKLIEVDLRLLAEENSLGWYFSEHTSKSSWSSTQEYRDVLLGLYEQMKELIEEYGANRLLLLTTEAERDVPDWLEEML